MPWYALAFLAGVAFVETRAGLQAIAMALPLLALLGSLVLVPQLRVVGCIALGVLWAAWRAQSGIADRLEPRLEGATLLVAGDVASIPARDASRVQFELAAAVVLDHSPGAASTRLPSLIRLSWYGAQQAPRAGERWQLEVRLRQPRAFANPGGFDYEGQLLRDGIGATGYVRSSARNRQLGAASWRRPVLRLREAIARRIEAILAGSPAAGVVAGLAVGATTAVPAEQWRVFSATGTTHLVAISGLHVTMVAALAMLMAGALWHVLPGPPRQARRDFAAVCGVLAAAAYSLLAGFSVPTQRTLAMLVTAFATAWLRRAQPAAHVLALALFAVLLLDPHAVLAPGFWLSFGAVAAIFLALHGARGTRSLVHEFLRTQAAVSVALTPVTLALFGAVSLVAPLANLIAIPLFSVLLVPGTLLAVLLLGVAPPAGEVLLRICGRLFEVTWPVLEAMAEWPWALVHLPVTPPWLLVMLALAALVVIVPVPGRLRLLSAAVLLPLLFGHALAPEVGEADVDVLDVGQGLAIVVRTRQHALLYDTGPVFRSGRSAAELAVVPFLRRSGVRRLDMLVLSHADSDHAGGWAALRAALPILNLRQGAGFDSVAAPCVRGESWRWDGVHFEFLHPAAGEHWQDNDGSCVLRVSTATRSLLLLGDLQASAERRLAARGVALRADVVVVPHHGSRSSSTASLVAAAGARYAVISAGHSNRWGFPHEAVVTRWCAAGADVLETSQWGAISLRLGAGAQPIVPRGYRTVYQRYWHAPAPRAGLSRCLPAPAVSVPPAVRYHPARSQEAGQ